MIKVILWDIDGTLLDFLAAERNALRQSFAEFHLGECSDEQIARYSQLNKKYWARLEKQEITRRQVLIGRFEEFLTAEGLDPSIAEEFNHAYQLRLGDTICFMDQGYDLVKSLQGRVKQFAATNGPYLSQTRKLEKSGLLDLFDDAFISEKIGAEKPSPVFFDYVLSRIGHYEKDEVMIVGDSLTSDMRGGNLAGIRCCWYNPDRAPVPDDLRIDYNIQNLNQIRDILAQN